MFCQLNEYYTTNTKIFTTNFWLTDLMRKMKTENLKGIVISI